MKFLAILTSLVILFQNENPNLNQDIIYPKASEVKIENGETCEVISKKNMLKAKDILHKYWTSNLSDSTWAKYSRQYMTYNSYRMGTVAYINDACAEEPADYFEKNWCLGMATAKCYFTAFVNIKKKQVSLFDWNTYDK